MTERKIQARSQAILEFWFASLGDESQLDRGVEPFRTCFARWYGKQPEIDGEIRTLFEADLNELTQNGSRLDEQIAAFSRAPNGLLALVILLDQFPRNMYRERPEMYEHDPLALAVAMIAIRDYEDAPLSLVQRMFLYVPLMHVENLTLQQAMVRRFEGLAELSAARSPHNRGFFEFALDYARKHRELIETFGRFPHRNRILGRPSTTEEARFLERADSGF